MLFMFLLLSREISAQSYGYYKFFKNYGDSFYDYGEGTYHAVNGSSQGSDVNDGVHTDRGIYLDGTSDYVTIHSDMWGSPPVILSPVEISTFLFVISEGPLLHRYDSNSESMISVHFKPNGVIQSNIALTNDGGITYNSWQIDSPSNTYEIGKWNLIKIVISNLASDVNYSLRVNLSDKKTSTFSLKQYTESASCETLMGYDNSNNANLIVYLLHLHKAGSFDEENDFTTACFGNDSSCEVCPLSTYVCMHHGIDPHYNNFGASCGACINGCQGNLDCLDCPDSQMPICQYGTSVLLPDFCASSCDGCVGPSSNSCLGCIQSDLHIPSPPGSCVCISGSPNIADCDACVPGCDVCSVYTQCDICVDPLATPRTDGSGACECPAGTYIDTTCKNCTTCSQADECLTCNLPGAVPNTSAPGCSCPSNSSELGVACECDPYFFDSDSTSSLQCDPCHIDCDSCNDLNLCTTCKDSNATISPTAGCECTANAHTENGYCVCDLNFYNTGNSGGISCSPCHRHCATCSDPVLCITCKTTNASPNPTSGCDCPANSSMNLDVCECNSLFYDSDLSDAVVCSSCHVDCSDCSEDLLCLSCKDTIATPSVTSGCDCPANASTVNGYCECNQYFYDADPSANFSCTACHIDCGTCNDSSVCLTCKHSIATVNGTIGCNCPGGSSMNNGYCECPAGEFFNASNVCENCPVECVTCDASDCLTCSRQYTIPNSNFVCVCPANSTFNGIECVCDNPFYAAAISPVLQCAQCHSHCSSCSGSTLCLTCKDSMASPNALEGCECASNSTMNNGLCECNPGYFRNDFDICQVCPSDCAECDANNCLTCSAARAVPITNQTCECIENATQEGSDCVCNSNFYPTANTCEACHSDCEACEEANICLACKDSALVPGETQGCECPVNSVWGEDSCECVEGYALSISGVCEECPVGCSSCTIDGCTLCSDTMASINDLGVCVCPQNASMIEGICVCDEGYTSSAENCTKTVNGDNEMFKFGDSAFGIVGSVGAAVAVSSTVFLDNPMSLWTLINTVQMLSYIPLHNVKVSDKLKIVTSNFEITNFIPNVVLMFYGNSEMQFSTDKENWEKYTSSGSFFQNIGECISTLVVCLGVLVFYILLYILCSSCRKGLTKKLSHFRFNAFLRLFLELYLVLVFGSIISFAIYTKDLKFETENVIGASIFVVCVLAPLVFLIFLYMIREKIYEENAKVKQYLGSLFEEFNISQDFHSLIYYPAFLLRRLVFMVSLFYFYDYPNLQFLMSYIHCVSMLIVLRYFVKFKNPKRNLLEFLSEIGIFIIFIAFSVLNGNLSDTERDVVEISIIVIGFFIISLEFCFIIGGAVWEIAKKCKQKKPDTKTYVTPIKFNIEGEDESVFALRNSHLACGSRSNPNINHDMTNLQQDLNNIY